MKKQLIIAVSVCLLSLFLFVKCTKDNQEDYKSTEVKTPVESGNFPVSNYNAPAGANCVVEPGYLLCTTDCLFGGCCVAWNPRVETGGCACNFGFASCKTSRVGADVVGGNYKSTATRTINIYQDKFDDFLDYCTLNGIETKSIRNSYKTKLIPAVLEGTTKKARVDPIGFDLFLEDYTTFVNNLSKSQKDLVKKYIGE